MALQNTMLACPELESNYLIYIRNPTVIAFWLMAVALNSRHISPVSIVHSRNFANKDDMLSARAFLGHVRFFI